MSFRMKFYAVATLSLGAVFGAEQAVAEPLQLEFLPPVLETQDICNTPAVRDQESDYDVDGDDDELTDFLRIRYLTRDIRNLMDDDAEGEFNFINSLITRLAEVDPTFAGIDELFMRVKLHFRADRFDELKQKNYIPQLRQMSQAMSNNQRMELAMLYLDGIGVERDVAFAQTLIREAAYGGNARALLEIARMQIKGELLDGWDAPMDLTLTMAFGGMLGDLNRGVCYRAEQIAQEYQKGEVVIANEALSLAWRKFAADMGGAEAAWRVVEYHLNADADRKDNQEMLVYLRRAAELGLSLDTGQIGKITSAGDVTPEELNDILGYNLNQDDRRTRKSLIPFLELVVNIDGLEADEDGVYIDYLHEIARLPYAPGWVYTRLAQEVLIRKGRWKAEAEAMQLLEQAVALGDPDGMQMLASMLIRYRDDPKQINRAENLLFETISRFGMASSMKLLDSLYRCQVNDAPRLREADHWASAYNASDYALVPISATDLIALDPYKDPETIAKIQTQALDNRTQALADHAQRMQSNPMSTATALEIWASRINRSDQALEAFAELEFELATNPAERALAVEFFRRVYLNNGVTTALDLAIALVEDNSRDKEIADEIIYLLTMAGNRGEGAALRLKSRLLAGALDHASYRRSAQQVYQETAQIIEERGDFLALMFALPFVSSEKVDDYIDRAVSLMNCGTKDADEIGDIYAIRGDRELSFQWRQIGLHFEGGHVLSKLRLSNEQMSYFRKGKASSMFDLEQKALAAGDQSALENLFLMAANPDLPTYDPSAAAEYLGIALGTNEHAGWIFEAFRRAPESVREAVSASQDMQSVYANAAQAGNNEARYQYGMYLRSEAKDIDDLIESARWLQAAAEGGHDEAMVELAFAYGLGIGVFKEIPLAMQWLQRARSANNPRAAELANLIYAASGQ